MLWQARPSGLWALRHLIQADEKRTEPSEYSLPFKCWAYCLRNFVQVRYSGYIPTGEIPNARTIVAPATLTGTAGDNEWSAAAKTDGESDARPAEPQDNRLWGEVLLVHRGRRGC
eukprot:8258157-Pyramimonas_sp.AAC.1